MTNDSDDACATQTTTTQAASGAEGNEISRFDAAYRKACASSQPDDWMHAALLGQQMRNALTAVAERVDLVSYLERQWAWSKETFGPALRTKGIVQHITKELREIEAEPHDLAEWVDVIILAMDGFWRHGGKPEDLLPAMQAKQDRNFARAWPDWRTMGEDQAIEHDRSGEVPASLPAALGSGEGTAASDVLAERRRQVEAEGWTPEHDDAHSNGELAGAAACYALTSVKHWAASQAIKSFWPWTWLWWKPSESNRRRDLVKAGALILAEIERLDLATLTASQEHGSEVRG